MEYQGLLIKKLDETSGVSSRGTTWKKATYLLQENTAFPKHIVVSVFDGDVARVATWDAMIGKLVNVIINISAHQAKNGSWFNDINGYTIREVQGEKINPTPAQPQQAPQQPVQVQPVQQPVVEEKKDDDLPF